MRRAQDNVIVGAAPDAAISAWTDLDRWPAFVDGFAHVVRADPAWPAVGSEVVWRSGPAGRGEVSERVEALAHDRFVTAVSEQALTGTQAVSARAEEGGTRVELELEYELVQGGAFSAISDLLFIRRALRDSLRRTLGAFEAEAGADPGEAPGPPRPPII